MKIKIAAAAPEILPGRPGQNMANVLAAISQARADGAALLVLPAGLPEDMNRGALERQAGKMAVYPLTRQSLPREELLHHHDLDVLCCSADTPATASSHYDNVHLAALSSHENMAVVVMACPMGGDGGRIYTGQCIIAQNGAILANADGYATARVSIPSREKAVPAEDDLHEQSTTPWTPRPEMLPRILRLQGDALARRMLACGATQLSLAVGRDPSSLLALAACVTAVDRLKLSRRNIHADLTGNRAARIGAALGITPAASDAGLKVDATDLTARAIQGVRPEHYAVNATIPRSVAGLVVRHWANTCGNMELSVPIRSIVMDDAQPWVLYDFLLHFSLLYDMPKWALARLLDDTFRDRYKDRDIQQTLDCFFDNYRRPQPCDGPEVFPLENRMTL